MPTVIVLIAIALGAWTRAGAFTMNASPSVVIETSAPDGVISWAHWYPGHPERGCDIHIGPAFAALNRDEAQSNIEHEVGHCLGYHHTGFGVMNPVLDLEHPEHPAPRDVAFQQTRAVLPFVVVGP